MIMCTLQKVPIPEDPKEGRRSLMSLRGPFMTKTYGMTSPTNLNLSFYLDDSMCSCLTPPSKGPQLVPSRTPQPFEVSGPADPAMQ